MVDKANYHILIVEEKAEFRNDFKTKLSSYGYSVDQATSGMHALSMLEKDPYKLVIVGSRMKEMNGFEVLGLIRDKSDQKEVFVLVLDNKLTDDEKQIYNELKCNGYIQTTKGIQQVLDETREFIEGKKAKAKRIGRM